MTKSPVSKIMEKAIATHESRNATYNNSFEEHGRIMVALFPDGITLSSVDDFNRFGVLNMIVSKLYRYCSNFELGHQDSIHDLGVYSFMLEYLDSKTE